ncbi:MAG: anti-CBASS Acb1 family protein, partial [Acetobacteraceae bacterium]
LVGLDYPDIEDAVDSWGDSVLQPVHDAIRDAGLVSQSLASCVSDSKVDVYKIPGLTAQLSTAAGVQKVLGYLSDANVAKSSVNSLILDKEMDWERIQTKFEGIPQVMQAYFTVAAAAADIPATRLLGREPTGMNSTGESDIRNYYDRLHADQQVRLTPQLNRLDEVLIRHTFGKRDPDIYYEWNSLWQSSDSEKADIALKKAQAFKIDVDSGVIEPEFLKSAREGQLIEDGTYPGLEAAIDQAEQLAGQEDDLDESPLEGPDAELSDSKSRFEFLPPPKPPLLINYQTNRKRKYGS